MTLSDILSEMPDIDTLRTLAVVMETPTAQRMVNVHAWHGDQRCTVFPAAMDDGRWMAPADILPDCITPGGMYHAGFSHLDPTAFSQIAVMPISEVTLADPQPPQLVAEPNPEA